VGLRAERSSSARLLSERASMAGQMQGLRHSQREEHKESLKESLQQNQTQEGEKIVGSSHWIVEGRGWRIGGLRGLRRGGGWGDTG